MKLFGTEWLFERNTRNVESHGGMALLREAMGVQNKYNDRKKLKTRANSEGINLLQQNLH